MHEDRASSLKEANDLLVRLRSVLGSLARCSALNGSFETVERADLEQHVDKQLLAVARLRNEIFAPVSRLPDDVLSYIFSIPSTEGWACVPYFSDTVAAISFRWRAVALSTPALWTSIVVGKKTCDPSNIPYPPARRISPDERRASRNEEFLVRAKAAHLKVDIGEGVEEGVLCRFISNLSTSSEHGLSVVSEWHHVVRLQDTLQATADVLARHNHTLRSLTFKLDENALARISDISQFIEGFSTSIDGVFRSPMPNVKAVKLKLLPVPRHHHAFAACRTLSLRWTTASSAASGLLPILSCAPLLRELTIFREHSAPPGAINVQGDPAYLPELQVLSLAEDEYPADLLRAIRAPNLQTLSVQADMRLRPRGVGHHLRDFLLTSSALLTLELSTLEFPMDLPKILQCTPKLQYLRLGHAKAGDNLRFFRSMNRAMQDAAPFPCPRLNHIHLDSFWESNTDRASLNALYDFVEARRSHPEITDICFVDLWLLWSKELQPHLKNIDVLTSKGWTWSRHADELIIKEPTRSSHPRYVARFSPCNSEDESSSS